MKKTVCIVTATRAEWGLLRPVAEAIRNSSELELMLVATGTHFCSEFGNTYQEILTDGFTIDERVDIQLYAESPAAVSKTMGLAVIGFADLFARRKPDMLLVLGDRYETIAVCLSAMNAHIPIAHLNGGEITEGALDDGIRHSITKLSYLHFTSCEIYRQRVIQMGESPDRVFNTGATSIDNMTGTPLLEIKELSEQLGLDLVEKPYALVTYHPVTLERDTAESQVNELLNAFSALPQLKVIITKSNADMGGSYINRLMDGYASVHGNVLCTASMGSLKYLSALKHAALVIGNSSSGIVEAPYFKVPTVNIGDRQRGRLQAESIINCVPETGPILEAVGRALSNEFREKLRDLQSPYGDGHASERIADTIARFLSSGKIDLKKKFYDIK